MHNFVREIGYIFFCHIIAVTHELPSRNSDKINIQDNNKKCIMIHFLQQVVKGY